MTSLLALLALAPIGQNPVLTGADPHAAVFGDTVWIYPTDGTHRIGAAFWAFSSKDLSHWKEHGPILQFKDIPWVAADKAPWHGAWAPCVARKGKGFFFYFAVGPQGPTFARIGVAVGDSPAGPFRDSGKPLITGGNGFEAIDPMVFHDPKSGRDILYAGGSAGATLRAYVLDDAMTGIRSEVPVATPKNFTEGAFMHVRKGVYYLSYSFGGWRDASYSAHYSTAKTPFGPWTYGGPILRSDATHKGPGHHSIFQKPGTDDWYIAFHEWPNRQGDGPYEGQREVAVERLEYGRNGAILPVRIVDAVPAWDPKKSSANGRSDAL